MQIKRAVYKRGNSLETTLPRPVIWNSEIDEGFCAVFRLVNKKWMILFEHSLKSRKANPAELRRKIYSRAGSFEVTIPKEMFFELDVHAKKTAVFSLEAAQWYLTLEDKNSKDENSKDENSKDENSPKNRHAEKNKSIKDINRF